MIPIEQSILNSVLGGTADKYGLDHNLVLAVITHETNGKTFKTRYEPAWKYLYFARQYAEKLDISVDTEIVMQSMSWGLMQVMGSVAREHGFDSDLPKLTDPQLGLEYGCKHLKKMLVQCGGNESDAIAAYNAGSVRKTPGGMYENQVYVDEVSSVLRELRKIS